MRTPMFMKVLAVPTGARRAGAESLGEESFGGIRMNRVFRVVWRAGIGAWVVASEIAHANGKGRGRSGRSASASVLLAAGALLASSQGSAADLYWDVNGSTAGFGGTGVWNLSNLFWGLNSDGTTGPYSAWNNLALDNAIFGGTAGTVTLAAPVTLHNLTFQTNGYTISGSTLTLGGLNPQISHGGGVQVTVNSVLAGSNGLTINGGSTNGYVQLGASNTLTGGITLNSGGRLVASGSNSLNGASNVVTVNSGGALQINHSNAFGGNTSAVNLVLNGGASLWLGNQNLTHNITAHGGTVVIEDRFSGGNSTWTGNLTLTADTTLLVTNTGANDNTIFAGNLTDSGANRLSLVLTEGGGIDSSLYLTGTNSFTGGITVNAGQLMLTGNDAAAAAAGNVVTINGGIVRASANAFGGDTDAAQLIVNSGGRLRVETNHTLNHDVALTGGTAFIDGLGTATWNGTAVLTADTLLQLGVINHTLNVTGNLSDNGAVLSLQTAGNNVRFGGDLSFSGDFTLGGLNTWFDGGNYTYSGDTIVTTNARLLLNSTSLSPNSNIRFEGLNNGNVTVIYGTAAWPSIALANGSGGGELRWNGTGGFYALSGQSDVTVNLGGAGATLTWNDGLFVPDGHALILGSNDANANARQLDFQNGIDLSGGLRDVRADNGNINDHAVISGVLTGTGGLHVIGNGLLELTNAGNNYSGATVVGDNAAAGVGNLLLGAGGMPSPSSNLQINGFGTGSLAQHGGYVLLNAASGPFTRALGSGAGQVQWTASGGFGAIGGPQTVDIGGAGAMLTWGTGGFVPTGHALRFGGNYANSTINWQNGIDLGATDRTINVNEGQGAGYVSASDLEVSLNGVIQGAGALSLVGAGDVALNGLNTYSGTTYIGGAGTGGTGDNMWAWANTLADTGVASSLGTGATVVLSSHVGGLIYTGGATSTNRTMALNRTNTAIHHLLNYGGGALTWAGDITTTGSGMNDLRLGGTYATTIDANGVAVAPNVISGVISDGSGVTRIRGWNSGSYATGGIWRLTGANTFTGELLLDGSTFEVTTLGNAGEASSVGAGNLIADFRGSAGTLRYIGSGESTDRLLWSWGGNTRLESSGTGPLSLTNTGLIVDRNGAFSQSLGGTNTGDNLFAPTLVNGLTVAEVPTANIFHLLKEGSGLWALVTDNNAHANAYIGNTRIFGGALRADNAGAITGGFGATSSHGITGSSRRSSLIAFEGVNDGTAGVLGLTAASGGFFRGTTTRGLSFINNNGTTVGADPDGTTGPLPAYGLEVLDDDNYEQGVRWVGSGGFAAWDGTQVVNLFGDGREMNWGSGGFVPTNHQLVFGYLTADGTVDFRNGVNFGGGARTVHVNDGLADRDAVMSGVLRSTTVLGGLTKTGAGALTLTANNTYTGVTNVSAGTLEVGNGGTTGTLGSGAQAVVAAGATLVANRSNAYTLSQNVIGDGTLIQRGTGTTTMTTNSDISHVVLERGTLATPGTLVTDDVTFTDDGGATLRVTGTLETDLGTATLVTGGLSNDAFVVAAGGTVKASGGLGDGADTLDVAGTLDIGAGSFDLGAGNDTFTVRDNTNLVGTVLGGAGIDTLNASIAGSATLGRIQTFETLAKSGAGVLNVIGPPISDFATVSVNAGTLNIGAGGEIAAAAGGTLTTTIATGATLRVDGAFGCGTASDSITVSGNVVGAGTIDQCGGDDVLTLNDAADVSAFTGTFSGGAHTLGDTVNLNPTGELNFAAGIVSDYERLSKTNTGTATLNGTHIYVGGATIAGGTLDVNGTLETPTIAVADGTTLSVDGRVRATGPTQTVITGSAGANRIVVAGGAVLLANGDLGDGADVLDVGGMLDTGAGALLLGAGNDTLTIHDNTLINGTVDGGAGIDTLNANIAGVAVLSRIQTFETLAKSGVGLLNVIGPPVSDFANVAVNAGILEVGPGGEIAAAAGGTLTTTIATGATLRVHGAFGCGAASDSITVSGDITGAGTISQCGGDDTLTLTDTADLSGFVGAIDGGTNTAGDTVALNSTSALTFAAGTVTNYESLRKEGSGIATLVGTHVFTAGTIIDGGTLQVDDSLETSTVALGDDTRLSIDGIVQAAGAGQVTLMGSSGSNTVVVNAGATLLASGDLGDASDTLDVAGTLDTATGFNLGAGDDTFIVHDGTNVLGAVIGGAGLDTRVYDITGVVDVGALQEFEGLIKRNSGTLNINGPAATTDLEVIDVEGGILNVGAAASVLGVNTTSVRSDATLNIDGLYTGTAGADTFSVAGAVSGAGSISLDAGDDLLVLSDGANLDGLATSLSGGDGNDTVTVDITGSATLGGVSAFETLVKENSGTLHIAGPAPSDLTAVTVNGGVLSVGAAGSVSGVRTTMIAAGATLSVAGTYQGSAAEDLFETRGTVMGPIDLLDGDDLLRVHADVADLADAIFNGGAGTDTLAYTHDTDRGFPNAAFSTFESLRKEGVGTLAIAGTLDAFAQSVAVATGTVDLQNATVQTAQFTIEQPAALRGAGTLNGDLTNAGLLAPGHSPGTLAIGGNYVQTATGVLVSEISRAGDDRLDITGAATLGGTQRLQIEYGYYLAGTTHTLISAAGGTSGDFTNVEANTSALLPYQRRVNVNSETVTFTLRPTVSVTTPDSNRGRFAAWLDGQISAGLVTSELETYLDTLIQQTTDAQVEALLGELADPPASTTQGTASVVASSFAGSVLDRFAAEGARCALASVASEALNCGWTAGLRQWGGADGDAFGPKHDWTIDGTQLGFERRLASGWAVGVTFGYGSADIHDANDSYAQLRAPTGGLYAQFSGERLSASIIALYSDVDNDVTRRATVGSDVRHARASFSSDTIGAGGRLDWRFGGETGPLVQPYLEAFYDRTGGASFVESGAAMNLAVHARAREGLRGTLGVLLADDYEGYGRVFRPSLQVGVAHQFLDTYSEMDVRLGGQTPLRVRGVALERTSLALKAELAMSVGRSASVSIGYGGELAENFAQHQFNVRAQIAW